MFLRVEVCLGLRPKKICLLHKEKIDMTEEPKKVSALKAIRLKCLDCSAGSPVEVRNCELKHCALWPYRFGKNPNRPKRVMTEEQKAVVRERFAAAKANREPLF